MNIRNRQLQVAVVISIALAVNAFVLAPLWILAPAEAFSDTAATPAFGWSQRASWLLLTLLVPLLPSLFVAGRRGTPPAWLAPVVQVAFAAQATTHFFQGFVTTWLLPRAPEVLDLPFQGDPLEVATVGIWVFFLVANVAFAVALWRAGHNIVGAGLMALGAVATPTIGPLGAGLLAVGIGIIAIAALRSRTSQPQAELAHASL